MNNKNSTIIRCFNSASVETFAGMIGIDLFAGGGGLTHGARLSGIDVRVAVESHPSACLTYQANHPHITVIATDIINVETIDIGDRDKPVVLFGGPPCQGFSTSNQRTRHAQNPKNWLFREFLRMVGSVKPEWVVFENVAGILQTDSGRFAESFRDELTRMGYRTAFGVLNAVDFGCPQKRSRYFLIGSLNTEPELPIPSTSLLAPTLWEAIGDLPELLNGAEEDILTYGHVTPSTYARSLKAGLERCTGHLVSRNADPIVARYRHVPQGGNWQDIPGMMRDPVTDRRRYHSGIYKRLVQDAPSVVIGNFRKSMLIHPTQDRGLSVREAARIQSFPDRYLFRGSIGFQQQQVGNAVPPILAKAVFDSVVTISNQVGGR
ncbi:DNA cytosine methyltransferase [Agrobacterium sp. BA1120]|uniref:DNA cytosine methyltransferase n=1 Tax=Agrobacterium sp. BA1120 TaxID=3228927 RepID=UPI003369F66A